MGKTIILSENGFKHMIKESIDNTSLYYRACSFNEAKGNIRRPVLWLTPDLWYAMEYMTDENSVIMEFQIDYSRVEPASLDEIDDVLGYEFDPYVNLSKEEAQCILEAGYNSYTLYYEYGDAEGLCLLNDEPIISKRIMSTEEIRQMSQDLDN